MIVTKQKYQIIERMMMKVITFETKMQYKYIKAFPRKNKVYVKQRKRNKIIL